MLSPRTCEQILDQEFLTLRCKVLDLAAGLDRLSRTAVDLSSDPRHEQLKQAIRILLASDEQRTEQVQLLLSEAYDTRWREALGL